MLAEAIGEVLAEERKRVRAEIAAAIEPLQARLAEVETRGIEFCGTWQRALDYRRGSMVVHGGSLWAAVRAVSAGQAQPGNSDAWQLCAKAGRDAKAAGGVIA